MRLPKHILVATDFSAASGGALDMTAVLAKACGARVSLVHVFDVAPLMPPTAIPPTRRMEAQIERETAERVQAELEKLREMRLGDVPDVDVRVIKHPNPALALCEQADEGDVDLIVVGSHGRTGLKHLLIGSVAERVIRHAPCPVLAVRDKA